MKNFDFKCPKCGTEFTLVENNMKKTKSMERIEALRNAGVDTSSLFAISSPSGEDFIAKNVNGQFVAVEDNDPIFKFIIEQGTVPNNQLFRRFVMAQTFRGISYFKHNDANSVNQVIQRLGYEYQWKMTENELYAQYKMYKNGDIQSFVARNRWFNKGVVCSMVNEYVKDLVAYFDAQKLKTCKGVPYKTIHGKNIFVADFNNKIYDKFMNLCRKINASLNPAELYHLFKTFNKSRYKLGSDMNQNAQWVDAYKGAGGYYTMQNMIRFHNCFVYIDNGVKLNKEGSLRYLEEKAEEFKDERGWCMYGMMRAMINDNDIDVDAKIASWRK